MLNESMDKAIACDATTLTYLQKIGEMFVGGSIPLSICSHLKVSVPNFTNDITATFNILDETRTKIYDSTALAKDDSYLLKPDVPITSKSILQVVLSGAAGGSGGTIIAKAWSVN